jgi:hypothetical protein
MFRLYHISAIIRCYKSKETRYTELKVFSKIYRIKVLCKILSLKYPIRICSVIYKLKLTARKTSGQMLELSAVNLQIVLDEEEDAGRYVVLQLVLQQV